MTVRARAEAQAGVQLEQVESVRWSSTTNRMRARLSDYIGSVTVLFHDRFGMICPNF
jgi:hypothetical protein